jgi:hypothetical protein
MPRPGGMPCAGPGAALQTAAVGAVGEAVTLTVLTIPDGAVGGRPVQGWSCSLASPWRVKRVPHRRAVSPVGPAHRSRAVRHRLPVRGPAGHLGPAHPAGWAPCGRAGLSAAGDRRVCGQWPQRQRHGAPLGTAPPFWTTGAGCTAECRGALPLSRFDGDPADNVRIQTIRVVRLGAGRPGVRRSFRRCHPQAQAARSAAVGAVVSDCSRAVR